MQRDSPAASRSRWLPRWTPVAVPRGRLTFVQFDLPPTSARRRLEAVRLQLTQFMPPGGYAFVYRETTDGRTAVWAWPSSERAAGAEWPEPLLDTPPAEDCLLLRQRDDGYEAQRWSDGQLTHTRFFPDKPTAADWARFARGAGVDPDHHPLPTANTTVATGRPPAGWQRGDNLPKPDPWQGWRWQAAVLALGAIGAAAAAAHFELRHQTEQDERRLAELRLRRESALTARQRYEAARKELDSLLELAPTLSQLDLLDRVVATGIFNSTPASAASAPVVSTVRPATPFAAPDGPAPAASTPAPAAPKLIEWEYRGNLLRLTLEIPEAGAPLLEMTRRLEAVPGLSGLKVGQEMGANTLSLVATVDARAASSAYR